LSPGAHQDLVDAGSECGAGADVPVLDDLPAAIPVTAGELAVLDIYLSQVLEDLQETRTAPAAVARKDDIG
jgi:hypothetical protein